jgi:hypothetical protein
MCQISWMDELLKMVRYKFSNETKIETQLALNWWNCSFYTQQIKSEWFKCAINLVLAFSDENKTKIQCKKQTFPKNYLRIKISTAKLQVVLLLMQILVRLTMGHMKLQPLFLSIMHPNDKGPRHTKILIYCSQ